MRRSIIAASWAEGRNPQGGSYVGGPGFGPETLHSMVRLWFIDLTYLFFLFKNISPYFWSSLGVSLCVGLSVIGAAWCVWEWMWMRGVGRLHSRSLAWLPASCPTPLLMLSVQGYIYNWK